MNMKKVFENGESIEFSGKIIVKMAQDPNIKKYNSKVVSGAEYAQLHGIKDIDNRVILSIRQFKGIADALLPDQYKWLAKLIPGFLKVPQFVIDIATSKF